MHVDDFCMHILMAYSGTDWSPSRSPRHVTEFSFETNSELDWIGFAISSNASLELMCKQNNCVLIILLHLGVNSHVTRVLLRNFISDASDLLSGLWSWFSALFCAGHSKFYAKMNRLTWKIRRFYLRVIFNPVFFQGPSIVLSIIFCSSLTLRWCDKNHFSVYANGHVLMFFFRLGKLHSKWRWLGHWRALSRSPGKISCHASPHGRTWKRERWRRAP